MTPKELAIIAAKALDEKKGKEIAAIEIADLTSLADYFCDCQRHLEYADQCTLRRSRKGDEGADRRDASAPGGYRDGTWVLLDYGCICVHVFSQEAREFYGLERLWRDGRPLDLSSVLTAD